MEQTASDFFNLSQLKKCSLQQDDFTGEKAKSCVHQEPISVKRHVRADLHLLTSECIHKISLFMCAQEFSSEQHFSAFYCGYCMLYACVHMPAGTRPSPCMQKPEVYFKGLLLSRSTFVCLFFEPQTLSEPGAHTSARLDGQQAPQDLPVCNPIAFGFRSPCHWLSYEAGHPSSSPQVCTVSSFSAELSLHCSPPF